MNPRNRKLNAALLALLGFSLLALGFWADRGQGPVVANASAGIAGAPVAPAADNATERKYSAAPAAPNDFSEPILASFWGDYDNYPGIAASPIDGSVTIPYGTVAGEDGRIVTMSNHALADPNFTYNTLVEDRPGIQNTKNRFGPSPAVHDRLGRRHMLYWYWPDAFLCDYYVMYDAQGNEVINEQIPGSCETSGTGPRKVIDIAVDDNLDVHIAMTQDNNGASLMYWRRNNAGQWTAIRESINLPPCGTWVSDLTIGASTGGTVMAAYKGCPDSGTGSDIWAAKRLSANNWLLENISASCCTTCPNTSTSYLPDLAQAPDGGLRISWSDGKCGSSEIQDIYYREWHPATGWDGSPIVRVVHNSGSSYMNSIAVDESGEAHIVWADTTSSPIGYYRVFYSHGRGTSFTPIEIPFQGWAGNAWQRDVAIDAAYGHVHVAFASVRFESQKDNFYAYKAVAPPPSPTPTNTPTPPCNGQQGLDFQDVCLDNTFFNDVRHVYTSSIMTGYPCGGPGEPCGPQQLPYFRPGNATNRGQMAKIVVLGANLTVITPTVNTFQDVAVGSTFFPYVETANSYGVAGGYLCGGPGEPCVPPGNKPYYRPGNNVTRGQLSKMVSVAFGYNEAATGQTFQDVPPGSTFYTYTQRLANRSIVSGYACGGPGEPCVPPGNRPYYRPNNSVTRGQTAKFIHLARMQMTPTSTPTMTPTATGTAQAPTGVKP